MIIEHSKKMGRGLLVYVMLELTVLVSTRVYAQVAGASLGTVTDASGAAVPTAVCHRGMGPTRIRPADSAGFYSAPNLLPPVLTVHFHAGLEGPHYGP
jgi:hypothetical protein